MGPVARTVVTHSAGTSTGGMVMARVAELARERVARVVFADALALLEQALDAAPPAGS